MSVQDELDALGVLRDAAHRRMLWWLVVAVIGVVMACVGSIWWNSPTMYILWGVGIAMSLGSMYFGVRKNSKRFWALHHDYDVLLRACAGLELLKHLTKDADA